MAYDELAYLRADDFGGRDGYRGATNTAGDGRMPGGNGSEEPAQTEPRPVHLDRGDTRDTLGVHVGWEVVLLVGVLGLAVLLWRLDPDALRRPALDTLLVTGTAIGLLALGGGLSLRAAVPNLALGPIAVAAALHLAEQGDQGLAKAAMPALGVAAGGAIVVGLLIVVLGVPGWAATLGAALGVLAFIQMRTGPVVVQGEFDPTKLAFPLFGGLAVLAVLGGAIGAVGPVRRWLGRLRPDGGDPAGLGGAGAAGPVLLALVLSSVFAVGAGILMAAVSTGPVAPDGGLQWTGIALGLPLLAGTSSLGRRGGIFGTLFTVVGLTIFLDWSTRRELRISDFATAAVVLAGGLVVNRLVEGFRRPRLVHAGQNAAFTTARPAHPMANDENSADITTTTRSGWDTGPWGPRA